MIQTIVNNAPIYSNRNKNIADALFLQSLDNRAKVSKPDPHIPYKPIGQAGGVGGIIDTYV